MVGRAKILWVEDDEFLDQLVASKFSALYDLSIARDAAAAFKELERSIPDVIVLDILLPGMNGFGVLETLKREVRYKNIPVIVLSNLGQQTDIDRAMGLGAAVYLVKANFSLDEVVAEIDKVLAASKK
jgi:DNA-binding response OmpR family regulator